MSVAAVWALSRHFFGFVMRRNIAWRAVLLNLERVHRTVLPRGASSAHGGRGVVVGLTIRAIDGDRPTEVEVVY